jgi:hypothetical protein
MKKLIIITIIVKAIGNFKCAYYMSDIALST